MTRILSHALLIVAVLAATGSHWLLLQSVAWTGMFAHNLRNSSIAQAVNRTFNGQHPCSLCKQISQGKQAEKKNEFRTELKKLEGILDRQKIVLNTPPADRPALLSLTPLANQPQPPPVPPPRSFLA